MVVRGGVSRWVISARSVDPIDRDKCVPTSYRGPRCEPLRVRPARCHGSHRVGWTPSNPQAPGADGVPAGRLHHGPVASQVRVAPVGADAGESRQQCRQVRLRFVRSMANAGSTPGGRRDRAIVGKGGHGPRALARRLAGRARVRDGPSLRLEVRARLGVRVMAEEDELPDWSADALLAVNVPRWFLEERHVPDP
jgi:hypothetical protein